MDLSDRQAVFLSLTEYIRLLRTLKLALKPTNVEARAAWSTVPSVMLVNNLYTEIQDRLTRDLEVLNSRWRPVNVFARDSLKPVVENALQTSFKPQKANELDASILLEQVSISLPKFEAALKNLPNSD